MSMRRFLAHLVISVLTLLGTAYVLTGFMLGGLGSAIFAALIMGLANASIRPVLLLVTLPINLLTLGLFTWVVNAIVLKICAALTPGFEIEGWGTAILGALMMAIINSVLHWMFGKK